MTSRKDPRRIGVAPLGFFVFILILSGCTLIDNLETGTSIKENVELPSTGDQPAISIVDQEIVDGKIYIDGVFTPSPGWIVIYSDHNGTLGPIIGYSHISTGLSKDIPVEVSQGNITPRLYALLHEDLDKIGQFQFPGSDEPLLIDEQPVMVAFKIEQHGQATSPAQTGTSIPASQTKITGEPAQASPTGMPFLPPPVTTIGLELIADGFTSPVVLASPPDGSGRLFVADQIGLIWILKDNGQRMPEPFLDIRKRIVALNSNYDERGLLGMAFSPNYGEDGRIFVYYSAPLQADGHAGYDHTSHLSEFVVSARDPDRADPNSERIILRVDQPQANNNGGQIAFGPDGYLYIPLGDGGGEADTGEGHVEDWDESNPGGNGQDISQNLLGSILRIDINSGNPYGIPEDNPFAEKEAPEIYAYGFRNPYRITFDSSGDHILLAGDVGQNMWEEIDLVVKGGNYGWNVREGTHCFDALNLDQLATHCPQDAPNGAPLLNPVIEYANSNQKDGIGLAIIGGYIYRGSELTGLTGYYIFGDWSASIEHPGGTLFIAAPNTQNKPWEFQYLTIANFTGGRLDEFLLSFGQDSQNELYLLTSAKPGPSGTTGKVYRIVLTDEGTVLPKLTQVTPTQVTLLPTFTSTPVAAATPTPTSTLPAPTSTPTELSPTITPTSEPPTPTATGAILPLPTLPPTATTSP